MTDVMSDIMAEKDTGKMPQVVKDKVESLGLQFDAELVGATTVDQVNTLYVKMVTDVANQIKEREGTPANLP